MPATTPTRSRLRLALAAVGFALLANCSGGGGDDVAPPPVPGPLTVSPAAASISTIQTQQFTATNADGARASVTWQVDGIAGGDSGVGRISSTGLFVPAPVAATHTITATALADPAQQGHATASVGLLSGVLTYHNDNARTGQNLHEQTLKPGNVDAGGFGRLYTMPVDGFVYAQPLYVADVPIAGRLHNILVVATEHNSVYAFDADRAGTALWHRSFIDPSRGVTTVPSAETNCDDINPEVGITSTPVIDPATGTLYVVAKTKETGVHRYRLHALDITSGADRPGSGVALHATLPGTSSPDDGSGRIVFDATLQNQRMALLLSRDTVYIGVGSYCDFGDHRGWLLAHDAKTLAQRAAFSTTPNGSEGGLWQAGGGAAADADGQLYAMTGDGSFDPAPGVGNYGNSVLRLNGGSLAVMDYFTPFNQALLTRIDGDLGSGGAVLLPDQAVGPPHLLVGAGKHGVLYLIDRDRMGGFNALDDSQIVQSLPGGTCGAGFCPLFGTPAYFQQHVYTAAVGDRLRAYSLAGGRLSRAAQSANTYRWPGATPVVSAHGSADGIVWTLESNGSGAPAVLRAHAAADVSVELYNSNQRAARDAPGPAVKFAVPTIAQGRVYVGAQGQVAVFGLLP